MPAAAPHRPLASPPAVPVLMYHHVGASPGLVTVSAGTFARQIAHLAGAGYTALSAAQFLAFLRRQAPVPRKSVLITFDDGFLDNYLHAFPILQRHGMRAVVFAVSGWVGEGPCRACAAPDAPPAGQPSPNHRECMAAIRAGQPDDVMCRWSELRLMEQRGVLEAHSHTHTHQRWDQLLPERERRLVALREDLQLSSQTLRERLGRQELHLCWPWGRFDSDYQAAARETGFAAQYTTRKGVNTAGSDPAAVARIVVKDRAGGWFARRLWIYRHPLVGALYTRLRGA